MSFRPPIGLLGAEFGAQGCRGWTRQRLMTALEMNQADLPHLEIQRTQFGTLLGQAEDLAPVGGVDHSGRRHHGGPGG